MYENRPIKETNEREVSKRLNTFELCLSPHHACALLALFKILSKVSSLLNLLYSMTAELTFENFSKWYQRPMAVVSACCNTL